MKSSNLDNTSPSFEGCHDSRQYLNSYGKCSRSFNFKQSCGNHIFEIGILIMVTNLMTAIYIWQSISSGWKITQGGQNFPLAFVLEEARVFNPVGNQADAYIGWLRVIFSFFGNKESLVLLFNFFLLFTGMAFFYRGSRRKIKSGSSLILTVLAGIICVFSFDVNSDSSMVIIWTALGVGFWLISYLTDLLYIYSRKSDVISWIFSFLIGGLTGGFLFFDMSGILLIFSLLLFMMHPVYPTMRNSSANEELGQTIGKILAIISGVSLTFFLITSSIYTYDTTNDFFLYAWISNRISFYSDDTGYYQLISLSIVFLIYWILHIIYKKLYVAEAVVESNSEIVDELQNNTKKPNLEKDRKTSFEHLNRQEENMITSSCERKNMEKGEEEEAIPGQIEINPKVKLLHNPLPGPKKHVKKVMNYAFEPSKDKMHYDLNNYNVNDDYDLK